MTLTLKYLKEQTVQTRRGEATKWNFQSDGVWYSAFQGEWNQGWQDGMTIEVDDDQVTSTEKDGKVYWNVLAPGRGSKSKPNNSGDEAVLKGLREIYKKLAELELEIKEIKDSVVVKI